MVASPRSDGSVVKSAGSTAVSKDVLFESLRLRETVALREEVIYQLNRRIIQLESASSTSNATSSTSSGTEPVPEALAECYSRIETLTQELNRAQLELDERERTYRQEIDELSSRLAPIDRLEKTRFGFLVKPIYRAMRHRSGQ
jgi:DNA repair ATPase RecN